MSRWTATWINREKTAGRERGAGCNHSYFASLDGIQHQSVWEISNNTFFFVRRADSEGV